MTTFPDGLFQYGGQPVGAGQFSSPWAKVYFVDGTNGSDGHDGLKPTWAKATVQAAVTAASEQDIIYVRPLPYVIGTGFGKYAETVTVPLAKHNLSIIGVQYPGNSDGIPRITTVTAAYPFTTYAASLHLENMGFKSDTSGLGPIYYKNTGDNVTAVGGNYSTAYNCSFRGTTGHVNIEGGVASRWSKCIFELSTGTVQVGSDHCSTYRFTFEGCEFHDNNGVATTGPYLSTGGANAYNLIIKDCVFGIVPTGAKFIVFNGNNSTGGCYGCYFTAGDITVATSFTMGTTFRLVGCYDYSAALIV